MLCAKGLPLPNNLKKDSAMITGLVSGIAHIWQFGEAEEV